VEEELGPSPNSTRKSKRFSWRAAQRCLRQPIPGRGGVL
jgi:hypothetical protein